MFPEFLDGYKVILPASAYGSYYQYCCEQTQLKFLDQQAQDKLDIYNLIQICEHAKVICQLIENNIADYVASLTSQQINQIMILQKQDTIQQLVCEIRLAKEEDNIFYQSEEKCSTSDDASSVYDQLSDSGL